MLSQMARFLLFFFLQNLFIFTFWPCRLARGIVVPRPGIEPMPLAVKARSPNHWTIRESLQHIVYSKPVGFSPPPVVMIYIDPSCFPLITLMSDDYALCRLELNLSKADEPL